MTIDNESIGGTYESLTRWQETLCAADLPEIISDTEYLAMVLYDSARALASLRDLPVDRSARALDKIADIIFDSLDIKEVTRELAELVAAVPLAFKQLVLIPARDFEEVSRAILRFWDKALGALSPDERMLDGNLWLVFHRALEELRSSGDPVLAESAEIGLRRLGT